jgi:glycerol kinase
MNHLNFKHFPGALLGHGCLNAGEAKNTYGTGTFMLCNTGKQALTSQQGLLTTIAYQVEKLYNLWEFY